MEAAHDDCIDDGVDIPEECELCGFDGVKLTAWKHVVAGQTYSRMDSYLCEVCIESHLSDIVSYPNQFTEGERKLGMSMGWLANKILQEIAKK